MNTWVEELYSASLELNIPAGVVQNIERLPDLITKSLFILRRYSYFQSHIILYTFSNSAVLVIPYKNHLLGRQIEVAFNIAEPYPEIRINIIDTESEIRRDASLEKYFIQKSNRKVSHDDFCLANYPGDLEEKVKGFADFLHAQFKIRGLFWLDGTFWMQGYGLDRQ